MLKCFSLLFTARKNFPATVNSTIRKMHTVAGENQVTLRHTFPHNNYLTTIGFDTLFRLARAMAANSASASGVDSGQSSV